MSAVINQIQLSGRAGHPPDLRHLSDGTELARLRLYHDAPDHSGRIVSVPYSLVGWGPVAVALHRGVRRGDRLLIVGSLVLRRHLREGQEVTHPEIKVTQFFRLGGPRPQTETATAEVLGGGR